MERPAGHSDVEPRPKNRNMHRDVTLEHAGAVQTPPAGVRLQAVQVRCAIFLGGGQRRLLRAGGPCSWQHMNLLALRQNGIPHTAA